MGRDRRDGTRIKLPALMQCCIDLKPNRYENEVYINQDMDVTKLVEYLAKKKEAGEHYTFFYALLTVVAKVMYSRPKLNRFISNRHLYEHKNVLLSFVAKMTLNDKSEEIMLCLDVKPEDNLKTLSEKTTEKIDNLRGKKGDKVSKKGANSAVDVLSKLPNILRVPFFGFMKFLAKRGLLPAGFSKDNIYFSSMIISNMGSIHCGAIYHNLAEFGTCSGLTAMGEVRDKKVIMPDGSEQIRKMCEFGITLDERIADGYYFAKSCRLIQYILDNPELLEEPAGKVIEAAEVR